jgi:hypothetical protein
MRAVTRSRPISRGLQRQARTGGGSHGFGPRDGARWSRKFGDKRTAAGEADESGPLRRREVQVFRKARGQFLRRAQFIRLDLAQGGLGVPGSMSELRLGEVEGSAAALEPTPEGEWCWRGRLLGRSHRGFFGCGI